MGKAVVSTTVGAEGLPVVDGTHLSLADEPQAFASTVIDLLRHRERRARLETAAGARARAQCDWSAVAGSLEDALVNIADRGSRTADSIADSRTSHPSEINLKSAI